MNKAKIPSQPRCIITARIRRMGEVLFSQVCLSTSRSLVPGPFREGGGGLSPRFFPRSLVLDPFWGVPSPRLFLRSLVPAFFKGGTLEWGTPPPQPGQWGTPGQEWSTPLARLGWCGYRQVRMGYPPPNQVMVGYPPWAGQDGVSPPPPTGQVRMGTPLPQGTTAERGLATRRAVCLLRSRRRTVLLYS